MNRLKINAELSKMYPETDEQNRENFLSLLPSFFYTDQTDERIEKSIQIYPPMDDRFHWLDTFFDLNQQGRAWYELPACENDDKSYETYQKLLLSGFQNKYRLNDNDVVIRMSTSAKQKIQNLFDALKSYSTFIEGRFEGQKLFKYLIKNKILDQKQVEEITHARCPAPDKYLVISRNPIDFLFASTDQSFTSCIDLNSTYSSAYYMALPALTLDPNRVILFVTNGKIKNYSIHNYDFRHFSYINRSWGIVTKDDSLIVARQYPSANPDLNHILPKIGYSTLFSDTYRSKFGFSRGLFEDKENRAMIYLDPPLKMKNIDGQYYYDADGSSECPMAFDYPNRFENLDSFDELIDGDDRYNCAQCGTRLGNDEAYSAFDDTYCESCFNDRYTYCEHCNEVTPIDTSYPAPDGGSLCSYCYQHYYFRCDGCGDVFHDNNGSTLEDGAAYCEECYGERYANCEKCDTETSLDELENGLCPDCYAEQFAPCNYCHNDVLITDLHNGFCPACNIVEMEVQA